MKNTATIVFATCLCFLLCNSPLSGQNVRLHSFAEGQKIANNRNAILVVTVHGSDWNPMGERFLKDVITKLPNNADVIHADVDWLQSDDPNRQEANTKRNNGWQHGRVSVPAVLIFGPDGTRYGVRNRLDLFADSDPRNVVEELVELGIERRNLTAEIAKAENQGDQEQELKLLAELIAMPLDRPKIDLERIREMDPQDQFGIVDQITFPGWFELLSEATSKGKSGNIDSIVSKYSEMLKKETYSSDQRALILLALGTVYQQSESHQELAKANLKSAHEMAPESKAGRMAEQRLRRLFPND